MSLQEVTTLLEKATTGMLIDAMKMAGLRGAIAGVHPVRGFESARVIGPATTAAYAQIEPGAQPVSMYRAIRESRAGEVLVIDGMGLDAHFAGDNMGETAKRQGLLGVVVFGGARDLAGYRAIDMPLYCTGASTRPWPANFQISASRCKLDLGGTVVEQGDLIVADEDGVVAVPHGALHIVARHLQTVIGVEEEVGLAIRNVEPVEVIHRALAKKKPVT